MEFFQIFLVAIVLVALCFVGLAIKVLLSKRGRFPNIHIGGNKTLQERGITCFTSYDKMEQKNAGKKLRIKKLSLADDDELHVSC
jgi:hypothetical protein